MKRPDAGQDGEPEEQNGEDPVLELQRELKLCELFEIERVGAGCDINCDNADQRERAAEERIERQLHRAVFLVRRTPDRDEEILRDNDELVENEEKKKIGAQEHAVGTADDQKQPEKELVRPFLDVPRKENGTDRGQTRDQAHRQANAVDGEMIFETETLNPGEPDDCFESSVGTAFEKRLKTDSETGERRQQRHPACENVREEEQQERAAKGDVDGPGDHRRFRIGEHTRLACCFRRLAENHPGKRDRSFAVSIQEKSSRWRGRHRQHARRVRSPESMFNTLESIATPCSVNAIGTAPPNLRRFGITNCDTTCAISVGESSNRKSSGKRFRLRRTACFSARVSMS